MDFHGMKRKDLQALCKKHGIPANLKNIEMASRLASVFEETEKTFTDTISLSEDSVDVDVLKDDLVVKKVRFSPENEVFEFTRSVKRCQRKNVRTRCKGNAQDLQECGTELRRSTRNVAKGKTVAGSNENESNTRRGRWYDVTKALKAPRRSKRIGSCGSTQEDCKGTELMALEQFEFEDISEGLSGNSQDGFELEKIGRRSTLLTSKAGTSLLVDIEDKEDELVKNNVKEVVSMDFEVQETEKCHRKDLQDDPKFENVPRRSRRIVNDIDVQANTIEDQRRSTRLKARAANPSMGGESSDRRLLCSVKESKEEIKTTKQSKGSTVVNSQEGELVKNKTKEPSIDCEVQTTEDYRRMKVQDASKVEKVPRRSKRRCNDINVLMDKQPVKAVKRDDLGVKKAPKQSRQREKSLSELLVDGQAQKGDKQPKRTFGNGSEDKKLLRSSTHTTLDNTLGQAMRTSPKRFSAIDCERDGASVDNVKKSNVNDEMQVHVRFTRNSLRHDSFEAPIVVEGNLVEKKTEESLEKKRDRSAQSNQTPRKLLDQYAQFEQEEAGGANVESRGSSKRSKAMNHKCVKDKPQGMIENSPSSSDTKARESVMITENVLDSTPEKAVDSSQRTNTQELNSELKEDKSEKRLERDTVLVAAIKENKKEVSSCSVHLSERLSPASVQYSVSNPTGHIFVKDSASTVVEENINTKEEILICTISELKEHSSVEAILENSAECWKEIHPSKDEEKSSLEKEVQAANLHGNFFEYNTENNSAEEEMEITKVGCLSAGHCVNLTPEKLLDEYAQLDPEEAGGPNVKAIGFSKTMKTVDQEFVKDTPQGMAEEDSPSTSETKATEPVMISKNALDSALKVSANISLARNTQELDSELLEGEHEEKHEQKTFLMAVTKKGKGEASSLSEFLVEHSEVKTRPDNRSTGCYLSVEKTTPPASVQLPMSNPKAELGVPTSHTFDKDIVLTVITEESIKTKEETLTFTPRSELKEHRSVSKLAKIEAILANSTECCKEIHLSKDDDEKGSSEKDIQAANLPGNFSKYNTETSSIEEEMEISKVGCMSVGHCVNLIPEKLLDKYAQMDPEEAGGPKVEAIGSSKTMKTVNQECVKDKEQGMEDSPSTSETKAAEPVMISENVLESTIKSSVDISPRGNTQELHSELMEGDCEEKHEQDTVLMVNEKEESSSLSLFLIERSEVSNPEVELFVETTPPPTSVLLAVSNPEAELGDPTAHILVKDIASTVIAKEDIKTKKEILISTPTFELKEHSFVAKLGEAEAILENSSECRNEIQSSKDGETGSLKKTIQAENLHGNYSGYNTENSKVACISFGDCVNLEMLDKVKDEIREKSEQRSSFERGCKLKALELRRCSSTDFTSHSLKENNVSKCFEEDKTKALSLPLPGNNDSSAFDELAIFTSPERKLMLMEQISEKGKTLAADSVTQHNDEAVESHAVVFTTPKHVSTLGDAGIDEAGKEEEHTATDFPDEFDVINTTERYLMLGGSKQTEARNEGESIVVELHDESDIATISEIKFSVGDFKGDRFGMNEENRTVELQRESGTCTSLDTHTLLGNYVSGGGNKPMEFYEESVVFTDPERYELFGSFGQDKARESEGKKVVQLYEKSEVSTGLHSDKPLANSELSEAGWQGINSADKSGLFTSVERQLLYGGSEQKEAVKTGEKAGAEFRDGYAVPNIPVRHPFPENSELDEAAKGEENKPVELRVDSGIFTSAEKHLETDEGVKGDNITAKSHVVSDVLTAAEGQFLMGESEPDEAEKKCRENKDVELLGESNTSSNPERHMLFGDSELDGTKNIRDYTATTCEESFVFTSPERRQLLVNFKPYSAGNQEQKEVNDSVVQGSLVAAPDFKENIIADSSGSIASKVSHSHDCNAGKETAGAELMPKGSPAEDAVGLDTTQGTSKKSREHFPHVDSLNLFDFDTEAETIMEAERNVSFSSYVTLPAKGNSEIIDEISRYLEVAGTCSMVSEEPGRSTDIQNQVHDPLEGLAITTDNNEADELIETKLTKNIQKGFEGNFLLNSSGGSYVSGKTCILAGMENEDKAASPIATAFEKTISLTPDEFTVQNNMNEKDKEMIRREATPETGKEYLKIDESDALSEMQVRREPSLIYRTQVKPKRHDMKENAPNSKIVHNLNVTAPRISKRRPLQDLRKN